MSDVAPTLPASRGSLHPAGRRSPEASLLEPVQTCSSSFGAAGSSPAVDAAPAVWQSQSRGPCLKGKKRRLQGYVPVSCAPCASLCIPAIKFSKLFLGQHD